MPVGNQNHLFGGRTSIHVPAYSILSNVSEGPTTGGSSATSSAAVVAGRKVRFDGNSDELIELAKTNAMALGAGHTFIVFLDGGFPVNCLNAVKAVPEVCRIHCATNNPTSVVIAKTSEDAKVRCSLTQQAMGKFYLLCMFEHPLAHVAAVCNADMKAIGVFLLSVGSGGSGCLCCWQQ